MSKSLMLSSIFALIYGFLYEWIEIFHSTSSSETDSNWISIKRKIHYNIFKVSEPIKKRTFLVWVHSTNIRMHNKILLRQSAEQTQCANTINNHTSGNNTRNDSGFFFLHLLLTDLFDCVFGSQNSFACPSNFIQWLIIWMILPWSILLDVVRSRYSSAYVLIYSVSKVAANWQQQYSQKHWRVYSLIDKSSDRIICFVFIILNNLLLLFTLDASSATLSPQLNIPMLFANNKFQGTFSAALLYCCDLPNPYHLPNSI